MSGTNGTAAFEHILGIVSRAAKNDLLGPSEVLLTSQNLLDAHDTQILKTIQLLCVLYVWEGCIRKSPGGIENRAVETDLLGPSEIRVTNQSLFLARATHGLITMELLRVRYKLDGRIRTYPGGS